MSIIKGRPLISMESSKADYKKVNAVEDSAALAGNLASQAHYRATRPGYMNPDDLFPFKIYRVPAIWRQAARDPETDWRTLIVRSGMVLESEATGTDGVADPYSQTYPDAEALDNEVIVPADTEEFWFWLELGEDSEGYTTAIVRYGIDGTVAAYDDEVNPPWESTNPWLAFPRADSTHVPIGKVNTAAKASYRLPVIRQIICYDLVFLGSGCDMRPVWQT